LALGFELFLARPLLCGAAMVAVLRREETVSGCSRVVEALLLLALSAWCSCGRL